MKKSVFFKQIDRDKDLEKDIKVILYANGFNPQIKIKFDHQKDCDETLIYVDNPGEVGFYQRETIQGLLDKLCLIYDKSCIQLSYISIQEIHSDNDEKPLDNPLK